jgi:hypothetical protein
MFILAFVLLLEFVTVVFFFIFDNFQTFLEKLKTRNKIWLCQDSQQRIDTNYEFDKETVAHMKENLLFPNKDFIPKLIGK